MPDRSLRTGTSGEPSAVAATLTEHSPDKKGSSQVVRGFEPQANNPGYQTTKLAGYELKTFENDISKTREA